MSGERKRNLKNFFKIFGKIALSGVVGSERKIERVWETSQQAKIARCRQTENGRFYGKGTPFLCLLRNFSSIKLRKDGKGMEKKRDIENNGFMPQKGNPLHETVTYKIGGTIFEVSTICGGSEPLYSKMERLIKAESVKTPTDKEKEVRYNEDSNLFVGRSLQEE